MQQKRRHHFELVHGDETVSPVFMLWHVSVRWCPPCLCANVVSHNLLLTSALLHVGRLHYARPCVAQFLLISAKYSIQRNITYVPKCCVSACHQQSQQSIRSSWPITHSYHAHLILSCHSYKCVCVCVCLFARAHPCVNFRLLIFLLFSLTGRRQASLTYWIVKHGTSRPTKCNGRCQMVFRMTLRQYYL